MGLLYTKNDGNIKNKLTDYIRSQFDATYINNRYLAFFIFAWIFMRA
jgi:hypothetical protein